MAYKSAEVPGSRRGTADRSTRKYYVWDCDNAESDVFAFVLAQPSVLASLPYADFDYEETDEIDGAYLVTINYGTPDTPQQDQSPGTAGYKFSFQAPSSHIKRSLATISATEDTAIFTLGPPPMHGAINVVDAGTADVHAEGFDLQAPPETFVIPFTDVDAEIDAAYQTLVRSLCGKVNNATFYGYAAGEIMLVRCDGSKQNGLWNIEFGFSYIPNATNIPVGDNIIVAAKDGHDLLWSLEWTAKDDATTSLIKQPVCAYVERVWERADLNDLNLPI